MRLLLLVLWLLPAATAQQDWTGCVDVDEPGKLVTIGEKTTLCLQIGNTNHWAAGAQYIRLSFQPVADEYSRIHVPNCEWLMGVAWC